MHGRVRGYPTALLTGVYLALLASQAHADGWEGFMRLVAAGLGSVSGLIGAGLAVVIEAWAYRQLLRQAIRRPWHSALVANAVGLPVMAAMLSFGLLLAFTAPFGANGWPSYALLGLGALTGLLCAKVATVCLMTRHVPKPRPVWPVVLAASVVSTAVAVGVLFAVWEIVAAF